MPMVMLGQLGDIQSTNMYAYCANNPVMYLDPSGMIAIVDDLVEAGLLIAYGILLILSIVGVASATGALDDITGFVNDTIDSISIAVNNAVYETKTAAKNAAIVAATAILSMIQKNQDTRYWSATLDFSNGGPNIGRPLTFDEAVAEIQRGGNVICRFSYEASGLAIVAGGNVKPILHNPHFAGVNFYEHYHLSNYAIGSHIWYIYV